MCRLNMLGKKLSKDLHLKAMYTAGIQEMFQKGYAEEVDEKLSSPGKVWYVPHHGVSHSNKPNKVRVVFDCSARYKDISLNEVVYQGPDLTNKLMGVLQRFRQDEIALTADIEGMYQQIGVAQEDRDVLRFLWWRDDDVTKEPICYRMTVQPFSGVWSPSCASYALRKTVSDNTEFSFEARQTVNRNFYVDDCLKSVGTVTDAIELKLQLQQLLSRGGFKLVKWLSNNREVMASVQDDDRAGNVKGLDIRNDAIPNGRVLGIKWMIESNELVFDVDVKIKNLTRRGILSFISTMYDSLGLVSPAILMAKRIVQELTRKKVTWDELITEPELSTWKLWVEELDMLTAFKIPRCLKPWNFGQVRDVQLHHFSDASQVAYGVVSYIRYVNTSGIVHTALLCSKSRLAPLKTMTIPRLELCAAALAVQVDQSLRQELDVEVGMSYF